MRSNLIEELSGVALAALVGLAAACGSTTATSTTSESTSAGAGGASSASSSASSGAGAGTSSTAAASSTGTTSSGGSGYACEVKSSLLHFCTLYQGLTPDEVAQEMASCASLMGTSGTTCSPADALGTCEAEDGSSTTWYADGGTTAAEAETSCEDANGTWISA
jgi:hypothetical protein